MKKKRRLLRYSLAGWCMLLLAGVMTLTGQADFDDNGYADLAIGVEWEDDGPKPDTGAVNVLYGRSGGLSALGDQLWDQADLSADPNGTENGDEFGTRLAIGDFNGDGFYDLAASAPGENIGAAANAGAVNIIYGKSPNGWNAGDNEFWHQGVPGVKGAVESQDYFGRALAAGDFNGDGYDDLAIGVPYEDIASTLNAGCVNVLYGTSSGLTTVNDQLWYEGVSGLAGAAETADKFGYALASGDFNRDGKDDLAISIPGEDLGGVDNAGRVVVLYGTTSGLSSANSFAIVQGLYGVLDSYEEDDWFGEALGTGDFNGDGYADLAIGSPREDHGSASDVGAVNVLFGSASGLTSSGDQFWKESGMAADNEFGYALTAGDFNGDGNDELAVGIPYQDLGSEGNAGAVEVLYGASGGLHRRVANDFWHQGRSGILDNDEAGDLFGVALAAGDFNNDSYVDLAIGVRNEDIAGKADAGAVQILFGSSTGIRASGNQFWHQDVTGVIGGVEANDHFGSSLAAVVRKKTKVYIPFVNKNY